MNIWLYSKTNQIFKLDRPKLQIPSLKETFNLSWLSITCDRLTDDCEISIICIVRVFINGLIKNIIFYFHVLIVFVFIAAQLSFISFV